MALLYIKFLLISLSETRVKQRKVDKSKENGTATTQMTRGSDKRYLYTIDDNILFKLVPQCSVVRFWFTCIQDYLISGRKWLSSHWLDIRTPLIRYILAMTN